MRVQEVAALLNKSPEQVRRYIKDGKLHPTKEGKEHIFDRAEVLQFAQSRGIPITHPVTEREVHEDDFFMEYAKMLRKMPAGASLAYTAPVSAA
ncbi:MAG TPA: helix-turn-helix domain-containing protein [Ktedonobacteraceae bacterium]|jgi:excisionase family DNA binding protein